MILVTGPTGFVGRRVVEAIASGGYAVRALVRTRSREPVLPTDGVEISYGDVLDPVSLERACENVDVVIHLAAVIRQRDGLTFRNVNYQGTVNLLKAAASARVERFIYASALGVTSEPSIPYLYSRWMAEQEVIRSAIPHTILRFSVGFGEGDEFFNSLTAVVKLSPLALVAGDGKARFQPIAVEDVARCLVAAYERDDTIDRVLELGGPAHFTYDELLDLIAETLGARIFKIHVPTFLVAPVAAVMEALAPRPIVTPDQLKMLHQDNSTELDSVQKAFGFNPRPLRGNVDYILKIGMADAAQIVLGFMPERIRDH